MTTKRRRVTFQATKKVRREVKVSFRTSTGKRISFVAGKQVPRRERVTFFVRKPRARES